MFTKAASSAWGRRKLVRSSFPIRLGKVKQAAFRREIDDARRTGDTQSFAASNRHAGAVVDQQQIGAE